MDTVTYRGVPAAAIYTIGYSGSSLEAFVDTLKQSSIGLIVDVRISPYSRQRGFSKAILAENLADHQIDYQWQPELGVPRFMRDELTRTHDWVTFEEHYREILDAQSDLLWKIAFQARKRGTALLCLERDPSECHRQYVAQALVERCLISGITHLTPNGHLRPQLALAK